MLQITFQLLPLMQGPEAQVVPKYKTQATIFVCLFLQHLKKAIEQILYCPKKIVKTCIVFKMTFSKRGESL